MQIYVVGKLDDLRLGRSSPWSIKGVFGNEETAVAVCVDASYFVGVMTLDRVDYREYWPGAYYPKPHHEH